MPTIDIRLGDCMEHLPTLGHVDAVVADPPYGMGWDTDCMRFSGGGEKAHRKRGSTGGHNWGVKITNDDRPFDPSPWLPFPNVILWGSNHFCQRLPVGTTLIWIKRNDAAFGTFLSDAEIGWMKGGHGVYIHKDLSIYGFNQNRPRLHPAQKPVGLMKWCIGRLKLKPGATILDPYLGSGSTGVAAVGLGYNFIGIESHEPYFKIAERRIHAEVDKTALFGEQLA